MSPSIGGLSTVLAWRIALETLRNQIAHAWTVALLLAAPLIFLSVYSIMPNPEYDADCAFSILVAVRGLQRITCIKLGARLASLHPKGTCHPKRSLPRVSRQSESKNLRLFFGNFQILRAILAGSALCIPLFFKQNIGLPFLLTCVCAILFVLLAARFNRRQTTDSTRLETRAALAALCGVIAALLAGALLLQLTAGLGNYLHWTIIFAGQRRMPGLDVMLGVYGYPALEWMLPCAIAGLVLLRTRFAKKLWAQIAAFLFLAAPFLFALAALFLYSDDPDTRGDNFLMIWPLILVLATAMALVNLWQSWREPSLRALLPLVVLAAINGAMMSQQLWGSTYAIWPLLILLLAELFAVLDRIVVRAGAAQIAPPRFTLALTAFISATMLVCGGFYTASEERLSYAQFPDGPASAFRISGSRGHGHARAVFAEPR